MAIPTKFSEITKEMIKAYFGIEASDTSKDARIDLMLPIATGWITRYCRHEFEPVPIVSEKVKILPYSDTFFVAKRPVTVITSVIENEITLVEDTDYVCYKDEGRFVKLREINDVFVKPYGGVWSTQLGDVLVSYTGGEPLPMDVVQVFYEYVGIFTGCRTRSYITNAGIENVVSLNSVPAEFMQILDRYKKARTL